MRKLGMAAAIVCVGCGDSVSLQSDVIVGNPGLEMGVHGVREITFDLDRASTVDVVLRAKEHELVFSLPSAKAHKQLLLGLVADTFYHVDLVVTDAESDTVHQFSSVQTIRTDPLPDRWPEIHVKAHQPLKVEPGVSFLNLTEVGRKAYAVVLGEGLDVIWWQELDMGDGRIIDGVLHYLQRSGYQTQDLLGNKLVRYGTNADAEFRIDTPLHHDVVPDDDGFWSLSTAIVWTPYPVDYASTELETSFVHASVLVRYDTDGELALSKNLFTVLDPKRAPYDAISFTPVAHDWSHANAVVPMDDGGVLISLRHQDVIVRLDSAGDLVWLLGDTGGWSDSFLSYFLQPIGDDYRPPYHQHAPMFDGDELVVMDNGNYRGNPWTAPDGPQVSRVVSYRIDEAAMTVEQVWEFVDLTAGPIFSAAQGDADVMPQTGNVFANYGFVDASEAGDGSRREVHLVEFIGDDEGAHEIVMELALVADRPDSMGWKSYRSERVLDLYPPNTGITRTYRAR